MPMSAVRGVAFLCGLLAVALRITVEVSDLNLWWWLAAVVSPFGLYLPIARREWKQPKSFRLDAARPAFVAPASPHFASTQAIMWMFLGAGVLAPSVQARHWHSLDPAMLAGAAILAAPFFLIAVALLLVQRPYVRLESAGVIVQRIRRRVFIAWEELAPGGPVPPAKRRTRYMRLYLKAAPVMGWHPSEDVPIAWLHVDKAFLASSIRHYVEHPEHRPAIGTPEELKRLQAYEGLGQVGGGQHPDLAEQRLA